MQIQRARELDPSIREFQYPDFGFEDELNMDGAREGLKKNIWVLLADHISQFPRYERVRNLIAERTKEKLATFKQRIEQRQRAQLAGTYNTHHPRAQKNGTKAGKRVNFPGDQVDDVDSDLEQQALSQLEQMTRERVSRGLLLLDGRAIAGENEDGAVELDGIAEEKEPRTASRGGGNGRGGRAPQAIVESHEKAQ